MRLTLLYVFFSFLSAAAAVEEVVDVAALAVVAGAEAEDGKQLRMSFRQRQFLAR